MRIRRTITLVVPEIKSVLDLVSEYNRFQQEISVTAYNGGKHLTAVDLHHAVYRAVPTALPSQMKCSAIRNVAGAYASAKRNRHPATHPFMFKRKAALFLFNKDFSFTGSGLLSIAAGNGRQKMVFHVPRYAQEDFKSAVSYDCIVVTGTGKVTLCLTLDAPDPQGIVPVGIDLGVKNALVASTDTDTLFISGRTLAIRNKKSRKTRQRLQKKLANRKAQKRDTHSVRRLLKRLGCKQSNRNLSFCRETAAQLCKWAPANAVLVFEDLRIKQVRKDTKQRKGTRRKLTQWYFRRMTGACVSKAERMGIGVDYVDPAYTSQRCSRCGLLGQRRGNSFSCACGHVAHADVNASCNIRLSYAVLRNGGLPVSQPRSPESNTLEGKPPTLVVGY